MKGYLERVKLGDLIKFYSGGLMSYTDDFMYKGEAILLPRKGTLTNSEMPISFLDAKIALNGQINDKYFIP
jgi:hypothetical protein